MPNPILDFYAYPELNVHSLDFCFFDIFDWSNDVLESKHDYIQWFFPTTQRSICHPNAPVLGLDELCFFKSMDVTRKMQKKAFYRMMEFYGIGFGIFNRNRMFWKKDPQWLQPTNHNLLRITRILTSLKLFGNDRLAKKLFKSLLLNQKQVEAIQKRVWGDDLNDDGIFESDYQLFSDITMNYWINAMKTDPEEEVKKLLASS